MLEPYKPALPNKTQFQFPGPIELNSVGTECCRKNTEINTLQTAVDFADGGWWTRLVCSDDFLASFRSKERWVAVIYCTGQKINKALEPPSNLLGDSVFRQVRGAITRPPDFQT